MRRSAGRLYYFVIAAGAFFTVAVIIGLTNNLYTLYVIPVTRDLGISRGVFSLALTVRYITSAFCNLFMGRLYQKYGYRRPTTLLVALVALSFVGYSLAQNMLPYLLGALIYGIGEYFISTAALSRLIATWFYSHQGVVTGIVMAASGVGGSILSLVLSSIMETSSWRDAQLFSAGLLAIVAVMIFFVIRDRPEEVGLTPYHSPEKPVQRTQHRRLTTPWDGVCMHELTRKPYFYLTMAGMMLATIASNGVYCIVVPHLQDVGFSASFAARMLSLMLIMMAVDKILLGIITDRFGAHCSVLACICFCFLGIVMLLNIHSQWQAVAAAVLLSMSVCLNGFIQPLLAQELFGRLAYGTTLGIMLAMLSIGGLLSSPLVNFSFDLTGSYRQILYVLAGVTVLDAILLLPAFYEEGRFRRKVESAASAPAAATVSDTEGE